MSDALDTLATRLGILPSYSDLERKRHVTTRENQIALLSAMGYAAENVQSAKGYLDELKHAAAAGHHPDWKVVVAGSVPKLKIEETEAWRITFEDGHDAEGRGAKTLPALPLGRHLLSQSGRKTWLLAAPRKLPRPDRAWGITAPLYGLRSHHQGGIGTYRDLGDAAAALGQHGAAFLGVNPVHAGFPNDQEAISPYSPSHRRWLNTGHIATGAKPAATGPLITYPGELERHCHALRSAFAADPNPDGLAEFRDANGAALNRFATHQALSEKFGAYWCNWPEELQDPDNPAVRRMAEGMAGEIAFHVWAQFQAEKQLTDAARQGIEAGMTFGLYLDLAVGTHPHGAETWENGTLFARGVSIGAPPDPFAPEGQVWNLAPMIPRAMEAEGFATLAETLRRQFQFAKLLRIDHILGFERSFWATGQRDVPGAYVQMPLQAMLAVARIEAARAGATIIGEDLGNIHKDLRQALKSSGLLGCRLAMFEFDPDDRDQFKPAQDFDTHALASFSTHDLPTWNGWRKGADIKARHQIGQIDAAQRSKALKRRKSEVSAFAKNLDSRGLPGFLADSASDLVAVQIEDVFELEDQPNLPGTVHEYPNWRQRLPVSVQKYSTDPRLIKTAAIMNSSRKIK